MNYNSIESEKELHLDIISGEIDSIKILKNFEEDWEKSKSNMEEEINKKIFFNNDEAHIDVVEFKCKLPLLLNLYYADPSNYNTIDLNINDK